MEGTKWLKKKNKMKKEQWKMYWKERNAARQQRNKRHKRTYKGKCSKEE